ncbi:hypothetical protein OROHE_024201 [Orobanche hederae]
MRSFFGVSCDAHEAEALCFIAGFIQSKDEEHHHHPHHQNTNDRFFRLQRR